MQASACTSTARNITRTPCGAGHLSSPWCLVEAHNVIAKAAGPPRQRRRSASTAPPARPGQGAPSYPSLSCPASTASSRPASAPHRPCSARTSCGPTSLLHGPCPRALTHAPSPCRPVVCRVRTGTFSLGRARALKRMHTTHASAWHRTPHTRAHGPNPNLQGPHGGGAASRGSGNQAAATNAQQDGLSSASSGARAGRRQRPALRARIYPRSRSHAVSTQHT